jgi:hypothetical protein
VDTSWWPESTGTRAFASSITVRDARHATARSFAVGDWEPVDRRRRAEGPSATGPRRGNQPIDGRANIREADFTDQPPDPLDGRAGRRAGLQELPRDAQAPPVDTRDANGLHDLAEREPEIRLARADRVRAERRSASVTPVAFVSVIVSLDGSVSTIAPS